MKSKNPDEIMNRKQQVDLTKSTLYVIPTPIGNLEDITLRALSILKSVDLIAAEDTRHTALLLQHFYINTRLSALHDHNERQKTEVLLTKLKNGQNIALVCNAGTPLINDPGYYFVRRCREVNIRVVPLPGACAAITALSAAGIPTDRFCYEGFLPTKCKARLDFLKSLIQEQRTLIFYESTHRLIKSLKDMMTVWGPFRHVVLARELTKIWETFYSAPLDELLTWVQEDKRRRRGEIVLIVEGYHTPDDVLSPNAIRTLMLLLAELPLKKATALTAEIYSIKKNLLYRYGLGQQ